MAFEWLTQDSRDFLARGYLINGTTAEQRVEQIANTAEDWLNLSGFSEKFYDYMSKGWYSLSSPIWANFGLGRGLPISCYGSYVDDSMIGMMRGGKKVRKQQKRKKKNFFKQNGGGTIPINVILKEYPKIERVYIFDDEKFPKKIDYFLKENKDEGDLNKINGIDGGIYYDFFIGDTDTFNQDIIKKSSETENTRKFENRADIDQWIKKSVETEAEAEEAEAEAEKKRAAEAEAEKERAAREKTLLGFRSL